MTKAFHKTLCCIRLHKLRDNRYTIALCAGVLSLHCALFCVPTPARAAIPYIQYTVTQGTTLEAIAGHYGVPAQDILIFNGLDYLIPGETILIPNPSTNNPYTPPKQYTVAAGDTLQNIAQQFHVSISALRAWNGVSENGVIYPGMVLTIPVLYEDRIGEETPRETEPTETKPTETEPAETEPTETEPTETQTGKTEETEVFVEAEDGTLYVQGVPLYFQEDYPKCLYGSGTVASSGCSVTSLTMVANAITGYDYTVDELADYFGGVAESNMARLELGAEKLGLSFHKTAQFYETWEALKKGKIAIALMEETSKFTNSQHFIVLTGMSADGKRVYVNDSNKGNYDNWELKLGFENGFAESDILQGYSGGWVFERELEEKPARYSEERVDKQIISKYFTGEDGEVLSTNYPEIRLNLEERELLAKVIWAEARGEPAEGQQAIAEAVFNRMVSSQFGDTLNDVIYSEGQFRAVEFLDEAEPVQAQYQAIDRALFGTPVLNRNVFYFAPYLTNTNTYMQIGNHIFCYEAVEDRP